MGQLVSAERTKRGNVHSPPDLRSRTGNVTVPTPQSKKVQFTVPHSKPELHPTPSLTRKNVPLLDRGANNTIASGDTAIAYPQQDPHEWRLVAYRGAPHLSHKRSAQIVPLPPLPFALGCMDNTPWALAFRDDMVHLINVGLAIPIELSLIHI